MKTLILGIILGYCIHIAGLAYVDYAYVKRDNACQESDNNIMTCNQFKNAPKFEKFLTLKFNISCYAANDALKFIYCKE